MARQFLAGKVEGRAGEYVVTELTVFGPFLAPERTLWISSRERRGDTRREIALHGRSLVAAYLRVYGMIAAFICGTVALAGPSLPAAIVGAVALALAAWSWTWRTVRGPRAQRRSDLNYLAFGTRCEPRYLSVAERTELRAQLDKRWGARDCAHTPSELAQRGTDDAELSALAYGLLRLTSLGNGANAAVAAADADRIVDDARTQAGPTPLAPYRDGADAAPVTLADAVAARERAEGKTIDRAVPSESELAGESARFMLALRALVGIATVLAVVGGVLLYFAARPTIDASVAMLRDAPPVGRTVRITCDEAPVHAWSQLAYGKAVSHIGACWIGDALLPVRKRADDAGFPRTIEGRLGLIDHREPWVRDGLDTDPDAHAHALPVFVSIQGWADRNISAIAGGVFVALAPIAWVGYYMVRRRRRRVTSS